MPNTFKTISLLLTIITYASCSDEKQYLEKDLQEDFSLNQWGDNSHFIDLRSLVIYESNVYMVDYELNKVFVIDHDGGLSSIIGSMGRGPGELLGAIQIYKKTDTLYVLSASTNKLEVFNLGQHKRSIDLSGIDARNYGGRFSVDSQIIYMSYPHAQGSLSAISMEGKLESFFGIMKKFSTERQTLFQNHRAVFNHNNSIVAVPYSLPYVERYNRKGELTDKFSYESIPFLEERIQEAKMNLYKENFVSNYVSDVYISGDLLYLLMVHTENEKVYSNKIIVVDLAPNSMRVKEVLNLGPDWHNSLAVSQQNIWTVKRNRMGVFLSRYLIEKENPSEPI